MSTLTTAKVIEGAGHADGKTTKSQSLQKKLTDWYKEMADKHGFRVLHVTQSESNDSITLVITYEICN